MEGVVSGKPAWPPVPQSPELNVPIRGGTKSITIIVFILAPGSTLRLMSDAAGDMQWVQRSSLMILDIGLEMTGLSLSLISWAR